MFRINTFSHHYRRIYGQAVGKIPLDLAYPCPNRRQGGCIFCRPASFTPASLRAADPLAVQIARGKKLLLKSRFRIYFAYFQQESATAPPATMLMPVFTEVLADPDCIGLILSTRPDCLHPSLLDQLAALIRQTGKACHIELGLQSCHEKSLRWLNRNHSFADFEEGVALLRTQAVFSIGVHLLFGIPGESKDDMLATISTVCAMKVEALKFHQLQVIKDTPLHALYLAGQVPLFSEDQYSDFLLRAIPTVPPTIALHRLWATAHPELLVAPRWQTLTSKLSQKLLARMEELDMRQGQEWLERQLEDDQKQFYSELGVAGGKTC